MERTGVLTTTAPSVSFHLRAISASMSSRLARAGLLDHDLGLPPRSPPRPEQTRSRRPRRAPARSCVRRAAQASRPAPAFFDQGALSRNASGSARRPLRPMNSRRSQVQSVWAPCMSAKATRVPKLDAEGIAREQGAGFRVELRRQVGDRRRTRRAEDPFHISRDAQPPRTAAAIGQLQPRNLDRPLDGDVLLEVGRNVVADVFEPAVAEAVPRDIGRVGVADGDAVGLQSSPLSSSLR